MRFRNIFILTKNEFKLGIKNFIVIWGVLLPLVLSLLLSLFAGVFFVGTPKLGVFREGETKLVEILKNKESIKLVEFETLKALKNSVLEGFVDIGMVIPSNFDEALINGEKVTPKFYIFGESYARDRVIIAVTIGEALRDLVGRKVDISVHLEPIGEEGLPINLRILPLIILIAIFFGGLFIPSTSLILERKRKTIDALKVTPVNVSEIVFSKWFFGFILSFSVAILILLINNMFTSNPLSLLLILFLGSIMATFFGIILGVYINDMTLLFSIWKSGGIVIFFPTLSYLFPKIPEIVSKFFPTYYLIKPMMDISLKGYVENPLIYFFLLVFIDIILLGITLISLRKRSEFL